MDKYSALWPASYYLILTPEALSLYRYSQAFWSRDRLMDRRRYPLRSQADLPEALAEVHREFTPRPDDSWHLGLSLQHFTLVNFTLPAQAAENLDQAVHYALMRHVPYDLEAAHVHFVSRDTGERLRIRACVAPKSSLRPVLEAVSAAGITVTSIFPTLALLAHLSGKDGLLLAGGGGTAEIVGTSGGDVVFSAWGADDPAQPGRRFLAENAGAIQNAPLAERGIRLFNYDAATAAAEVLGLDAAKVDNIDAPIAGANAGYRGLAYQINLIPASVLRRRQLGRRFLAAAAIVLLVSLTAYPVARLAGLSASKNALQQKIDQISDKAERIMGMRETNQKDLALLRNLAQFVDKQPPVAEILKEITEILPVDTWLTSLILSEGRIELKGSTASASTLIESLENSPLFKDVKFDSPVTQRNDQEIFKITCRLE